MIYAPEAVTLYPWFAPTKTGGALVITTSQRCNGYWQTSSQSDSKAWTESLRPGTYTVSDFCATTSDAGISHLSNGGADLGTVDHYAASPAFNATKNITGVALTSGSIELAADTKHASSSGYKISSTFVRLTRTGE
jgi:pyruvate dehydrogenase complex dehydrogenase (E1) component